MERFRGHASFVCLMLYFLLMHGYSVRAQQRLVSAEYFLDLDPGPGNAVEIPINGGRDTLALNNVYVPVTGLSVGFHHLVVRVRDSLQGWGIAVSAPFYVSEFTPTALPVPPPFPLVAAEYFFGSDPGCGMGQALAIRPGDSLDMLASISVAGLPAGVHRLSVRTRDLRGQWSIVGSASITIMPTQCTPATPDFSVGSNAQPGSSVLLSSTSQNVDSNTTYGWYVGDLQNIHLGRPFDFTGPVAQAVFAQAGVYDVMLVLDAGDSCSTSIVKQVEVGAQPLNQITASGSTTFCSGSFVDLTAPAGSSWLWNTGDTLRTIRIQASGTYSCIYTDSLNLVRYANSVGVIVHPSPVVTYQINQPTNGMSNGSIGVFAVGGTGYSLSYAWSNGATTPSLSGLMAGNYTLVVSDGLCPQTFSFQLIDSVTQSLYGIVAAEVFYDVDPGLGLGLPVAVGQMGQVSAVANLTMDSLAPGWHVLGLRVKDGLNGWGIAQYSRFYVLDTSRFIPVARSLEPIVAGEYL